MKLIKSLFLGIAAVYAECQCPNGTASTEADCVNGEDLGNGSTLPPVVNVCASCDEGFYLNTNTNLCVANPVCDDGFNVDETAMPKVCIANACTCANGVGATGVACAENGTPFCASCTSTDLFDLANGVCSAKENVEVAQQTFEVQSALPDVTFVSAMEDQNSEIFQTTAAAAQTSIFEAASQNLPAQMGLNKDDVVILRLFDASGAAANRRRKRSTGVGVDSEITYTYNSVQYANFEAVSEAVTEVLTTNLKSTAGQPISVKQSASSVSINLAAMAAVLAYYFR